MSDKPHVLVLGGSGFLGEALVRQLAERGDVRLSLLVHRTSPPACAPGARILSGRLGTFDLGWCREDPPRWVFHCARLRGSGVTGRWLAAWNGRAANRRLIAALASLPDPPRLVYASGSLMFGSRGDAWVDESQPLAPASFARQNVLAERPFLEVGKRLPVMMVRPGWVLGDGSWFRWFYLERALQDGAVPLYGEGRNWMTFIHREDCASMMRHVAEKGTPGEAYNLAPGEPLTQAAFVEALAGELSLPVRRIPLRSLRGWFDRAPEEAFASSLRLRTRNASLLGGAEVRYADAISAMKAAVAEYRGRIRRATTGA